MENKTCQTNFRVPSLVIVDYETVSFLDQGPYFGYPSV